MSGTPYLMLFWTLSLRERTCFWFINIPRVLPLRKQLKTIDSSTLDIQTLNHQLISLIQCLNDLGRPVSYLGFDTIFMNESAQIQVLEVCLGCINASALSN